MECVKKAEAAKRDGFVALPLDLKHLDSLETEVPERSAQSLKTL